MEIKVLPLGSIQANCYLITSEKTAVVIDPGFESDAVAEFLEHNNDKESIILLTHCHFDHIGGAFSLRQNKGVKIAIGAYDNHALSDPEINLSAMFGACITPFSADLLLNDNDTLQVGDLSFKILHTPGHTVGGVCYLIDNILFSGDTLFSGSIGRTDFPGGDFTTLEASIKRLYSLNDDICVLSGHGDKTTIKYEKLHNPFVRG